MGWNRYIRRCPGGDYWQAEIQKMTIASICDELLELASILQGYLWGVYNSTSISPPDHCGCHSFNLGIQVNVVCEDVGCSIRNILEVCLPDIQHKK